MAGETRFEHATYGFGDHYSTVEPLPYVYFLQFAFESTANYGI